MERQYPTYLVVLQHLHLIRREKTMLDPCGCFVAALFAVGSDRNP